MSEVWYYTFKSAADSDRALAELQHASLSARRDGRRIASTVTPNRMEEFMAHFVEIESYRRAARETEFLNRLNDEADQGDDR